MSLILDALNRAERERGQALPPSAIPNAPAPARTAATVGGLSLRGRILRLIIAAIVLGVMLWWTLVPRAGGQGAHVRLSPASSTAAESLHSPVPAATIPSTVAPDHAPRASAPDAAPVIAADAQLAVATAREVASLYATQDVEAPVAATPSTAPAVKALYTSRPQVAQQTPSGAADAAVKSAAELEAGSKAGAELVAKVATESVSENAPAPRTALIDSMAVAAPAQRPSQVSLPPSAPEVAAPLAPLESATGLPTLSQLDGIVWFNDLSWQTRLAIPSINYAQHSPSLAPPAVMINGVLAAAGARAGEFTVVTIAQDGVVLEHGETRFKLAALNGWINI